MTTGKFRLRRYRWPAAGSRRKSSKQGAITGVNID